ncbi:LytTR family DNA-binding domain-containing protein [Brevundimonas goettingensis]|uniref:LytTR family transcriptional regulator DNA-binding domain-containing protein n=1 Tax=Brevundimonas goettingensis TaxID=2774190 RepID=A0A975GVM1_9CAUL|nr:LytTR family DNA-binding domain-containing protein [Brevundimonas goettingensis]QTC91572.1 LytTR family transcriptional regulator DNA-binding domain-containing protein [Brevundimonas goettingensis]
MPEGLNTPRAWAVDLAACAATGVVLGVVGPFGSFFNDVLPVRILYWTLVFVMSGAVFGAAIRWLWPHARRVRLPLWLWLPVLVGVGSLPLTVVSRLIAMGFWPGIRHAVGWVEWYGQSVLIGLIYVGLYAVLRMRMAAPAALEDKGEPVILRRLPGRLGRDVICLQMEDHYVRLHTAEGSTLVLMPLGKAMAEVGDLEGMQVHRSWWVARRAVEGVVEDGRNLRLKLKAGLEAPVSRAHVARLKAAGWLPDRD